MRSQSTVAGVISRDRVVIASCIILITALAWLYLFRLSTQKITMPMAASWSARDYFFTFAMWSVMMVGMMSASAAPVLLLFSGMQKNRNGRVLDETVLLFGLGYLIVWLGFSALVAFAQLVLHNAALLSPSMATTSSILSGGVLLLAGVYQFAPAKGACLRQCQTPLGFLMTNWRDSSKGALLMGLKHGKYCLGCCWALMLVLFVVGVMNLVWVAALSAFILLERFGRTGFYVARVGGVAMIAIGLLVLSFAISVAGAQERRPNIVVILADDMGYADIGINGSKDIPTPNIDSLAAVGIRFSNAYVSGPYCSPTRAGLMTGRYQQRFGHEFNFANAFTMGLPTSEVTIADRLKAAGYQTAAIGKWHLGGEDRFLPMSRGFDEFFGFMGGQHSYVDAEASSRNALVDGKTPVTKMKYLTDTLTDRAVDFIRRNKSRPFFLYLAYNAVHTPLQATEKYLARFNGIANKDRRTYAAMLSAMDDGIGRVVAALREENLESNTLIIFLNDNGGPTMQGTTINASSNAPLRGSKRQTYEGGIRVPFIIRWKGHVAEGKTDARPIIQLDILPTALGAAGINAKPEWKLDGKNLLQYLTGALATSAPHETLYWRLGGTMAIRKGNWKLVKTAEGPLPPDPSVLNDLSGAELYNLAEDIGEKNNLAAKYPAKFKELADDWQRWNSQLAKPLGPPMGVADRTTIPPRRSARAYKGN